MRSASDDDFISALTQEVKEEVVRNYLYERRLAEEQINYVKELAQKAVSLQDKVSKRFVRLYHLLEEGPFIDQFAHFIGLETPPFSDQDPNRSEYQKEVRFIKVRGLTDRGKYKRLLLESYRRLFEWNEKYRKAFLELQGECEAVNHNLKRFGENYDLLTIIRFLKEMDIAGMEKKHFLGENFTAQETGSIEAKLRFRLLRMDQFPLSPPLELPTPEAIASDLNDLADCVFGQCKIAIKQRLR